MIGIRVEEGLSPRVRGKHIGNPIENHVRRSIPACTGETAGASEGCACVQVYPRVYGGNQCIVGHLQCCQGLSPRVRGKPAELEPKSITVRSIPACTGETIAERIHGVPNRVYPRVYGGNQIQTCRGDLLGGLSPRVRGKRLYRHRQDRRPGSIPACTGETRLTDSLAAPSQVYPRVYGGNISWERNGFWV